MSNPKLKKMTNKQLIESAFKSIEALGYHIIDVKFTGSYYEYPECDNSMCNFHIKEIPRFLFAFWKITNVDALAKQLEKGEILWTDSYGVSSRTELLFFTQYERDLDKFKPSRSGFLTGIYREAWLEGAIGSDDLVEIEEWHLYKLEKVLAYMKKHPIKSYVYSGLQIRNVVDEISGIKCAYIFMKEFIQDKKYKFKEWIKLKRQINASIKLAKKTAPMYNSLVILRPDSWTDRVAIIIRRKEDADFNECLKLEPLFDLFDDRWGLDISLDQYDLELSNEVLTNAEKKLDSIQRENFIRRLTYYYTDMDTDYEVLWCNCEELIDLKAMK